MGSSRAPRTSASKGKRNFRKTLLSSSRPHQVQSAKPPTISSTAGRAVIRKYHTLHKRLSTAVASKDETTAESLRQEIESLGGLKKYQDASFAGQGKERGGDTSGVLVKWLSSSKKTRPERGLKMLEVGALDVDNACARCDVFTAGIERIDLNSRDSEIKEQDFMKRPLPVSEDDLFDVVSLSLVVNFVGDLKGRGDMLRRVSRYLRIRPTTESRTLDGGDVRNEIAPLEELPPRNSDMDMEKLLPGLFLVLPAPCVNNSRYLDEPRLTAMMESLGYTMARRKMSSKLVYYLWRFNDTGDDEEGHQMRTIFPKQEVVKKGTNRNNFAIVL